MKILGIITGVILMVYGCIYYLQTAVVLLGGWGLVGAIFLAPLGVVVLPIYDTVKNGNWMCLVCVWIVPTLGKWLLGATSEEYGNRMAALVLMLVSWILIAIIALTLIHKYNLA